MIKDVPDYIEHLAAPITADEFYFMGTTLLKIGKCDCDSCVKHVQLIRDRFPAQSKLAVAFVKNTTVLFKALMEDWGEKEIQKELEKLNEGI